MKKSLALILAVLMVVALFAVHSLIKLKTPSGIPEGVLSFCTYMLKIHTQKFAKWTLYAEKVTKLLIRRTADETAWKLQKWSSSEKKRGDREEKRPLNDANIDVFDGKCRGNGYK